MGKGAAPGNCSSNQAASWSYTSWQTTGSRACSQGNIPSQQSPVPHSARLPAAGCAIQSRVLRTPGHEATAQPPALTRTTHRQEQALSPPSRSPPGGPSRKIRKTRCKRLLLPASGSPEEPPGLKPCRIPPRHRLCAAPGSVSTGPGGSHARHASAKPEQGLEPRGRRERGEPAPRRTGAEAAVGHGHRDAGPAGLQAPFQLLDLPPDLLPLRVQVEGRGGQRGLGAEGAAGAGRARPAGHGCGARARAWAAQPRQAPPPPPTQSRPGSSVS